MVTRTWPITGVGQNHNLLEYNSVNTGQDDRIMRDFSSTMIYQFRNISLTNTFPVKLAEDRLSSGFVFKLDLDCWAVAIFYQMHELWDKLD